MNNACLIISLLCLNFVQLFLLFRYFQFKRDLAELKAFKDGYLKFVYDEAMDKVAEKYRELFRSLEDEHHE